MMQSLFSRNLINACKSPAKSTAGGSRRSYGLVPTVIERGLGFRSGNFHNFLRRDKVVICGDVFGNVYAEAGQIGSAEAAEESRDDVRIWVAVIRAAPYILHYFSPDEELELEL